MLTDQLFHTRNEGFTAGDGNVIDEEHILDAVLRDKIDYIAVPVAVIDDVDILIMRH